jgi:hypothetical protein
MAGSLELPVSCHVTDTLCCVGTLPARRPSQDVAPVPWLRNMGQRKPFLFIRYPVCFLATEKTMCSNLCILSFVHIYQNIHTHTHTHTLTSTIMSVNLGKHLQSLPQTVLSVWQGWGECKHSWHIHWGIYKWNLCAVLSIFSN